MSELTSHGFETDDWKSPRAVREAGKIAVRQAFDDYMKEADERLITREDAIRLSREFSQAMSDEES